MNRWTLRRPPARRIPEHVGLLVLARSSGYCEGCALGRHSLRAHPRGGAEHDYSPANWLDLCRECEELVEVAEDLAIRHGWIIRPNDDPHQVEVLWRNRPSRLTAEGKVEQQRISQGMAWRAI